MSVRCADVATRRSHVLDGRWHWLRQVHGAAVVDADAEVPGAQADAAVTTAADQIVSVVTADCCPVLLWSENGVVAAAHAGWKGIVAGVLQSTVATMRARGAGSVSAVLGPCICPRCYEFGTRDLDVVASRLGPDVRSATSSGAASLDTRRACQLALAEVEVSLAIDAVPCTLHDEIYFSHRRNAEPQRQAGAIVLRGTGDG